MADFAVSTTAIFSGQTVDATTVLIKYTYGGDVNLSATNGANRDRVVDDRQPGGAAGLRELVGAGLRELGVVVGRGERPFTGLGSAAVVVHHFLHEGELRCVVVVDERTGNFLAKTKCH